MGRDVHRLEPARGRLWSERLGLELGLWRGIYRQQTATWVRLFHPDGRMVLTGDERAEAAEAKVRALEAELARLRARLGEG